MELSCPNAIRLQKPEYANDGNRLNGLFLSQVMQDGEAVRKLIHNGTWYADDMLSALYRYYQTKDKDTLIADIENIESQCLGIPNISIDVIDGKKIITDWSFDQGRESYWADLSKYDEKHTIYVFDYMSFNEIGKEFENVSVAEVLRDTVEKRSYVISHLPKTGDEELDLLLSNLYHNKDKELHHPTYIKALEKINDKMIKAFSDKEEPLEEHKYIPAIIMLEEQSKKVFDNIDYREQHGFYKSKLCRELLKFSYLTSFQIIKFDENDLNRYVDDVQFAGNWQVAQRIITHKITENNPYHNSVNSGFLGLNNIRPRPKEKMYAEYYEKDLLYQQHLNMQKKSL